MGMQRPLRTTAGWSCLGLTCLALLAASACLLWSSNGVEDAQEAFVTRRLQAAGDFVFQHKVLHWGRRHTAALILSVLVSLTSSLDRECGASLYVVLFAVLLNMPFRRAAAMTAFTVALGALAPGIASMSEARLTERGLLPVADFSGCLVLLPTMFWGISFGVIVNLWFPNWLLCLMWVIAMAGSNIELLLSFIQYIKVKKEAKAITQRLHVISPAPSSGGAATAAGAVELTSAANGDSSSRHRVQQQQQQQQGAEEGMTRSEKIQEHSELMDRAQLLAKRAHRIEALALLYPTLYVPDVGRALEKANIDPHPCGLRVTATPSCIGMMDSEEAKLTAEQRDYQQLFGRFTVSWKKWWHLNRFHFELLLVLKVVVMHLVTEAVRHHTSHPCTTRFWVMMVGMTGVVTGFLMFNVTNYGIRRLWRGPHWVDALNQVRAIKKEQQQQELAQLANKAASEPGSGAVIPAQGSMTRNGDVSAACAAVSAGEAVTVDMASSSNGGSHDGAAVVPDAAAAAGAGAAEGAADSQQQGEQPVGCWGRFKKRLPWVWVTAPEAVSNINYCNSSNQYKNWRVPLILLCSALTFPIGVFGCALGLPGGPMMASMLLALGLKPEVVAGTSRFLVLCFTFGSFVAHIIAGGLEPTLAASFGLLNLALAPIGMFIIAKLRPRGAYVIGLSLFMGVVGLVVVTIWQLVPLMAALVGEHQTGDHLHEPLHLGAHDVRASLMSWGNHFNFNRFCHAKEH